MASNFGSTQAGTSASQQPAMQHSSQDNAGNNEIVEIDVAESANSLSSDEIVCLGEFLSPNSKKKVNLLLMNKNDLLPTRPNSDS